MAWKRRDERGRDGPPDPRNGNLDFTGPDERRAQLIERLNASKCNMEPARVNAVKALLHTLAFRCSDSRCVSWARVSVIAAKMGVSRRTAASRVRDAENLGVVVVRSQIAAGKGQRSNLYVIDWLQLADLTSEAPTGDTAGEGGDTAAAPEPDFGDTAGGQSGDTARRTGGGEGRRSQEGFAARSPDFAARSGDFAARSPGFAARFCSANIDLREEVKGEELEEKIKRSAAASFRKRNVDARDEWAAAAEKLVGCGLEHVRHACTLASNAGYSPQDLVEIADTYLANRSKFRGAGAITYRLRHGVWPAAGVRAPAEVIAGQRHQAEAVAATREAAEQSRRQKQADTAELEQLERSHGGELDALSRSNLVELARQHLAEHHVARIVRGRWDAVARLELLRALAGRNS